MPITICNSPETLKAEFDIVRKKAILDETEETWDTIAQGIQHLTHLCNIGGCHFTSEMVAGIRSISRPINNALNSERSRLSGAAVELVTALATGLGALFEPLLSHFIPTLLTLCGRTNKVFTSRARACILTIIQHTHLPSLLSYLAELANHKSVFPRLMAAEGILACLNCFNPPDLEKETRAHIVEDFIKLTARDANADVRKASKEIFKAYKTLMPHRVESFVAPLTPVVKKYLDIPSGTHGISCNATQKPSSRPSSRANNKATEAGQRPAMMMTLSRPPARPTADDSANSTRQRPAVHGLPTAADVRAPRQRTVSQAQRDVPPRSLHINTQSSGTAQRCAMPTSAPIRRIVQHPASSIARVPPTRNVPSSTQGPRRPPSVQLKFNPPPDRLKVPGDGAKRIPLPSVPVSGLSSGQVLATTSSATDRNNVEKNPSRSADATASGKSAIGRKAHEGPQSATVSRPANGSALTASGVIQRLNKKPIAKPINPSVVSQRCPAGNLQKGIRPLKAERKETSPTLIPLPPSPSTLPTKIPLPPSPDCIVHLTSSDAQDEPVVTNPSGTEDPTKEQSKSAEPCQNPQCDQPGPPSTPITTLLASIQRGFLFTPSSPLSPPQNYLPAPGNLPEKGQETIIVGNFRGPLTGVPLCIPLDDDSVVDGIDRHALRDLN